MHFFASSAEIVGGKKLNDSELRLGVENVRLGDV